MAHRVTRNLGLLTHNYLAEVNKAGPAWNGQHPPKPKRAKPQSSDVDSFDDIVLTAVGEVVKLAEGHSNITLGRLPRVAKAKKL